MCAFSRGAAVRGDVEGGQFQVLSGEIAPQPRHLQRGQVQVLCVRESLAGVGGPGRRRL